MGIYYFAVSIENKEYFESPGKYSMKSPGIYWPTNPFPGMVVMKNSKGENFEIWNDCGSFYDLDLKDITEQVFEEYKKETGFSEK